MHLFRWEKIVEMSGIVYCVFDLENPSIDLYASRFKRTWIATHRNLRLVKEAAMNTHSGSADGFTAFNGTDLLTGVASKDCRRSSPNVA